MVVHSQLFRIADMRDFLGEEKILPSAVGVLIDLLLAFDVFKVMLLPYFLVIFVKDLFMVL